MFKILFFTFLFVPLFEIYLLLQVGGFIGVVNTIALILFTAFLGTVLLQQQGISTLARFQNTLAKHQLPAVELLEGLMLLFAGGLLLTPGFFTDFIGFMILVPAFRDSLARRLISNIIIKQKQQGTYQEETIEAEFWEERSDQDRLR